VEGDRNSAKLLRNHQVTINMTFISHLKETLPFINTQQYLLHDFIKGGKEYWFVEAVNQCGPSRHSHFQVNHKLYNCVISYLENRLSSGLPLVI